MKPFALLLVLICGCSPSDRGNTPVRQWQIDLIEIQTKSLERRLQGLEEVRRLQVEAMDIQPTEAKTAGTEPLPSEDIDYWIKKNPGPVYTQSEVDMWGVPQRLPGGGTRTTFAPSGVFYIKGK